MTCMGRDPLCPCQDGLACHYRDVGSSKGFQVPTAAVMEWAEENKRLREALQETLKIARSWNLFSVTTMDRKPAACALRLQAAQKILDSTQ